MAELLRSCERLMDSPPRRLAPFTAAVRQYGGLVLYGLPGLEADDLIGSLVAGLLAPSESVSPITASAPLHTPHARPDPNPNLSSRSDTELELCAPRADANASTGCATATSLGAAARVASASATNASSPAAAAATAATSTTTATCTAVCGVTVASSDSDMLQLLAHPAATWLQLRHLSSPHHLPPVALASGPLPRGRVPPALMMLHRAAEQLPGAAAGAGGATAVATAAAPLLPASRYPDYLALLGKPEAGVPGVGLSDRSARRLVSRHGGVEAIAAAYAAGDPSVRSVLQRHGGGGGGGGAAGVGPAGGPAAHATVLRKGRVGHTAAGAATSVAAAGPGAAAEAGPGARGQPPQPTPPALVRALRNLVATRMHVHLGSVPWARVRAYQRERHLRLAPQVEAPHLPEGGAPCNQRDRRDAVPGAASGACGFAAAAAAMRQQHEEQWRASTEPEEAASGAGMSGAAAGLGLHPHDRLHLASAQPFVRALAAALRRRGLDCQCCCGGGGTGTGGCVCGGDCEGGSGASCDVAREPTVLPDLIVRQGRREEEGQEQRRVLRQLGDGPGPAYEAAAAAAFAAGVPDDLLGSPATPPPQLPTPQQRPPPLDSVSVEAAAEALAGLATSSRPPGHVDADAGVRVYVLSPWDFDTAGGAAGGAAGRAAMPSRSPGGGDAPRCTSGAGAAAAAEAEELSSLVQSSGPQGQGGPPSTAASAGFPGDVRAEEEEEVGEKEEEEEDEELLRLARSLRSAVGTRRCLSHVPPALKRRLRPGCAWRLARLQREAGPLAPAVLPFYELVC